MMLDAVGDVIEHIDECIKDQMTRPNFEPTGRFLSKINPGGRAGLLEPNKGEDGTDPLVTLLTWAKSTE
ncbi:hypothetical protein BDZ91DRAFT_731030 [Kalaharituber pfeilii]|nr:hypothetical protein BDZ91DRAFT_731030 [Kalaharituber pfeilii]